MIEIIVNDRLGKKVRIKCNPQDTVGDLKKLVAAQTGTRYVSLPVAHFMLSQIREGRPEEVVHCVQGQRHSL